MNFPAADGLNLNGLEGCRELGVLDGGGKIQATRYAGAR
jgi:hypothetical protein